MKQDIVDFVEGAILMFGMFAVGYYAGSKKAVKTFGDLDNRQDNLENRVWCLEKARDLEAEG